MTPLRVGRITLYVLDDGTFPFPAHLFFRNVPDQMWRRHLDVDAAGKIPVSHNLALVETERVLALIDTGYGDDTHGGRSGHLLDELTAAGFRPDDVGAVALTHAHGDHIKGSTILENGRRRPTFPRARYYLGRGDWEWFGGPGRVPEFDEHLVTLDRAGVLTLVDDALQLAPELVLRSTPGHTPGHLTVFIESEDGLAIFLGDVCHLPVHIAHPDWVSTFDTHPDMTPRTRVALLSLAAEREALVICPHAPMPGLGYIRRHGARLAWEPLLANRP
jgi:glyoxylase-like metal-dependent hydrolase (beta-lactamase superfamily II)